MARLRPEAFLRFREQLPDRLETYRMEEIIPLVLVWLNPKDIVACRLLCLRIKRCVHRILEEVPVLSPVENGILYKSRSIPPFRKESFEYEYFRNLLPLPLVKIDSLEELTSLQNLITDQAAADCFQSGIIGKSLGVTIKYEPDPEFISLNRCVEFLKSQNILRHIHVTISDSQNVLDYGKVYDIIWGILSALPGIQTCYVGFLNIKQNNLEEADLQKVVNFFPLPAMKSLEVLDFDRCPLSAKIFREITFRYGSQLKTMKILPIRQDYDGNGIKNPPVNFPGLMHLKATISESANFDMIDIQGENLRELEIINWKSGNNSVKNITCCLGNFPKVATLRLKFNCFEAAHAKLWENTGVTFDNIKTLHIDVSQQHVSLIFWTRVFPCLENLHVLHRGHGYHYLAVDGGFLRDFELLMPGGGYGLDIWKAKSLKLFEFKYYPHHRVNCRWSATRAKSFREDGTN